MGMYDSLIIDIKLIPATKDELKKMEKDFQTKDLECLFNVYEIRGEELLLISSPNEEVGEPKKIPFEGKLNFYDMDKEDNWYEFNAIFKKGKLQKIERVSEIEIKEQNDHIKNDVLKLQQPITNKKIDSLVNEFRKALRQKRIKENMKISKS